MLEKRPICENFGSVFVKIVREVFTLIGCLQIVHKSENQFQLEN